RAPRAGERPAEWVAYTLPAIGARYVQHPGCNKYAFRLGETRRERAGVVIAPPRLPYPKWPRGVPPAPKYTPITERRRRCAASGEWGACCPWWLCSRPRPGGGCRASVTIGRQAQLWGCRPARQRRRWSASTIPARSPEH